MDWQTSGTDMLLGQCFKFLTLLQVRVAFLKQFRGYLAGIEASYQEQQKTSIFSIPVAKYYPWVLFLFSMDSE
jgi:hypothetical protein